MIIYILRHGTTEWNRDHKIQGSTDILLDDVGREMARQTGLSLRDKGVKFDVVYSSPLKRAYQTALMVSKPDMESYDSDNGENSGIILDDRLRELCFGRQEGQRTDSMMYDPSVPFRYFKDKPDKYDELSEMEEDIESLTGLCARARTFLQEIIERSTEISPESTVLISGHGALNKALLMHIRNESEMSEFWGRGLQPNCGIDIVKYDENSKSYEILSSNNTFYDDSLTAGFTKLL